MPLKKYITIHFGGGKLDFSLIDDTHGFSLIDNENQNEFIDSFRKFEELDWSAIATDNGLDYKPYNKNKKSKRYFSDDLGSVVILGGLIFVNFPLCIHLC